MNKILKTTLKIIQGREKVGPWALIGVGFLGIIFSIVSHSSVWEIIKIGNSPKIYNSGYVSTTLIIGLLIVAALYVLRSVYVIIPVILYWVYMFEKLFGTGLLKLIRAPKSSVLRPGLYLTLPLSAVCLLVGAIGVVIYWAGKKE